MKSGKMAQAENARYAKIQKLICCLLCQKDKIIFDDEVENALGKPFKVGRIITVDGEKITVKKKLYSALDLKKVTVNTEGSMSIYDRGSRKLCGPISLNLSSKNIELFCLWARKYDVPAELVSGKGERTFQRVFLAAVAAIIFLIKLLQAFYKLR